MTMKMTMTDHGVCHALYVDTRIVHGSEIYLRLTKARDLYSTLVQQARRNDRDLRARIGDCVLHLQLHAPARRGKGHQNFEARVI